MIHPNELRIGNKIFNGTIIEVRQDGFRFSDGIQAWDSKDFIPEGIELSREVFEKTSLLKQGNLFCAPDHVRFKSAKDEGVRYCSFFFNTRLGKWMDTQSRITIDYLHQLQNYYFVMTLEELEINI